MTPFLAKTNTVPDSGDKCASLHRAERDHSWEPHHSRQGTRGPLLRLCMGELSLQESSRDAGVSSQAGRQGACGLSGSPHL